MPFHRIFLCASVLVPTLVACTNRQSLGDRTGDGAPADRPDGGSECTGVTSCTPGDGCCPTGCSTVDLDCSPTCGNARLDPGESCDTGIASGEQACPTAVTCADDIACSADTITGSACTARCIHPPIVTNTAGDGCCVAGATHAMDSDCPMACGDGRCDGGVDCGSCCGNHAVDPGEQCDNSAADPAAVCPTMCADDGNGCTAERLIGSAESCDARCDATPITTCANSDRCCPAGCTADTDNDCSPPCLDTCTAGMARCSGNSVETCTRAASGCTEWGPPVACSFGADSFPMCVSGVCSIGCNTGFENCDGRDTNGCEVHTAIDIANCGSCGRNCGTAGGTARCDSGSCSITCTTDRADCDGVNATGCESNLLTDSHNCGRCGHDCLGGSCNAGRCRAVTIATGLVAPIGITLDASYVYVTDQGSYPERTNGAIVRIPKAGGAMTTLASGVVWPHSIECDDTYLFYTVVGALSSVTNNYSDGSVWRLNKSGGAPTRLDSGIAYAWDLVLDETNVYWTGGGTFRESGGVSYYNYDGVVGRVAKTGGSTTLLASGQAEPVAIVLTGWYGTDGPELAWANRGAFYNTAGNIQERDSLGYLMTIVSEPFPRDLRSDGTYVYYSLSAGTVRRSLLYNPVHDPPTVLVPAMGGAIDFITIDDTHLYFANATLYRVPLAGGTVEELTTYTEAPIGYGGIVTDDSAIYWLSEHNGSVMRLAK